MRFANCVLAVVLLLTTSLAVEAAPRVRVVVPVRVVRPVVAVQAPVVVQQRLFGLRAFVPFLPQAAYLPVVPVQQVPVGFSLSGCP